ncbi:transcription factor bHLH140, putative [Medicago truncatula]|uniref:Transcription factor bHLH140, putative n=1 Tax=Medicago truncatula TaxID=3880 RepID=A0A072VF39_MEDTR|nr:transcription factor bHLH140, putative [Medicago truncatula]
MENIPSTHDTSKLGSKEIEGQADKSAAFCHNQVSLDDTLTLAFPSISTADFQFNHDKAADIIIVEKVAEYSNKMENAKLVIDDLTHKSTILSLVKSKAAEKNIDIQKFLTHVGDSAGSLRCNVLANTSNR